MAIVGFGASGGGAPAPGGVLPASLGSGDLLVGDAAGGWVSNPNLPTVAPDNEGQIAFWDGASRYRYTAVPTDTGQILQWDEVNAVWVLTAAPANGNILVFSGGLWVPQAPAPSSAVQPLAFGAGTVLAAPLTFLYPWYDASGGATTEAVAGQLSAPNNGVISRMLVRHGSTAGTTDLVYTLLVNGIATALTVTLNTNVAFGSNLVNTVAVVLGDRLTVQVSNPSGALQSVRPAVQTQFV